MVIGKSWQVHQMQGKRDLAVCAATTTEYESIGFAIAAARMAAIRKFPNKDPQIFRVYEEGLPKWEIWQQKPGKKGILSVKWLEVGEPCVSWEY